jgi:hypothetical protein
MRRTVQGIENSFRLRGGEDRRMEGAISISAAAGTRAMWVIVVQRTVGEYSKWNMWNPA